MAARLKYETPEELAEAIESYFDGLLGPILDKQGNVIRKEDGSVYLEQTRPATMTGLARALGFKSRQTILNYKGRKGFRELIEDAKMRVEEYTEEQLFNKNGCSGAKFSLENNFENWKTKAAVDLGAADKGIEIKVDLAEKPPGI